MSSNTVVVIVLAVIQISSFCCAIQILLRFGQTKSALRRLPNHLLICLLIVSIWTITIDVPFAQAFLWSGSVPIQRTWACVFYNISSLSTTGLNRMLMAFMSIERHFLVFRPQLYRARRSRFLIHFLPLILIILFILIYFIATDIFLTCPNMHFDYSRYMCGYTCTTQLSNFGAVFAWMHVFCPTVITIVASVLLPIRFIIQKSNLQRFQWHRARKMIIQTCIIASAYTICWLPISIILELMLNGIVSSSNPIISKFFTIGPYVTSLLTPFIVLHTVPGQVANPARIERIKRRLFPQRQNTVQPLTTSTAQPLNGLQVKNRNSSNKVPNK